MCGWEYECGCVYDQRTCNATNFHCSSHMHSLLLAWMRLMIDSTQCRMWFADINPVFPCNTFIMQEMNVCKAAMDIKILKTRVNQDFKYEKKRIWMELLSTHEQWLRLLLFNISAKRDFFSSEKNRKQWNWWGQHHMIVNRKHGLARFNWLLRTKHFEKGIQFTHELNCDMAINKENYNNCIAFLWKNIDWLHFVIKIGAWNHDSNAMASLRIGSYHLIACVVVSSFQCYKYNQFNHSCTMCQQSIFLESLFEPPPWKCFKQR